MKYFCDMNKLLGVKIWFVFGNVGVLVVVNDEIECSELLMMFYVYMIIVLFVFVMYCDLCVVFVCCLFLIIGMFIGYWFMKEL